MATGLVFAALVFPAVSENGIPMPRVIKTGIKENVRASKTQFLLTRSSKKFEIW